MNNPNNSNDEVRWETTPAQQAQLDQLKHNLTNHPPIDPTMVTRIEAVRYSAYLLGEEIILDTPPSREQSLALTNLEMLTFWAVAAIARNQAAPTT